MIFILRFSRNSQSLMLDNQNCSLQTALFRAAFKVPFTFGSMQGYILCQILWWCWKGVGMAVGGKIEKLRSRKKFKGGK